MTGPASNADATVAAVQEQAVPLGLAWQIKLGTVNDGANPAAITVQLDGDQTAVLVNASSMVGQLVPGERVYLLEVPPAGLYITGRMNGDERWLDGAVVDTAGNLVTTSGATESNITELSLTVPSWRVGHVYIVEVQMLMAFSVATDGFQVTLRRDTALTGTTLAIANFVNLATQHTPLIAWPLRPTLNEQAVDLFISVIRTSGTGTCTVSGSPGSSIARTWSGIKTANARTSRAGGVWRAT